MADSQTEKQIDSLVKIVKQLERSITVLRQDIKRIKHKCDRNSMDIVKITSTIRQREYQ